MSKLLIVNADDFGLEQETNSGIIKAHEHGVVTSASLIANGGAFEHAAALALEHPALDVGAHLTLTRGPSLVGGPLLEPLEVPTLVGRDGLFPQNPAALAVRTVLGLVSFSHVRNELRAQMKKVESAGIRITHIDSHQHIHLLPPVFRIVAELACEFGVKWIRLSPIWTLPGDGPRGRALRRVQGRLVTALARRNHRALAEAGLHTPTYHVGFDFSGRLSENKLEHIITNLPDGIVELSCHPGSDDARLGRHHPWGYKWQQELSALCSTRVGRAIEEAGVKLAGYSSLSGSEDTG
jgi:hopanoid biosynthesis associated protein HpnK